MSVPINRPGVWYPEGYPGRAFDLAQFVGLADKGDGTVDVRFRGNHVQPLPFNRTEFEDAYQAFVDGTDALASEGTSLNSTAAGIITFTRNTTAYDPYNNQFLPANTPRDRFFKIGNAIYPMVLIEGSSTNDVFWSTDLQNAAWTAEGITVAPATGVIAPDGTETAFLLTDDGTNGTHRLAQSRPGVGSTTYTASAYFKAGTKSFARILLEEDGAFTASADLDLDTGTISATGGSMLDYAYVEDAGDGWYRVAVTGTETFGTTTIYLVVTPSGVGDSQSIYAWAPQLEEQKTATSYIPTQGAAASRTADRFFNDLANFPGALVAAGGKWTIFSVALPYLWDENVTFSAWQRWWDYDSLPGLFEGFLTRTTGGGELNLRLPTDTSLTQVNPAGITPYPQTTLTTAAATTDDPNTAELFLNGASIGGPNTSAGTFEAFDGIDLGNRADGLRPFYGWTGSIFFPRILTPAEILALHNGVALA